MPESKSRRSTKSRTTASPANAPAKGPSPLWVPTLVFSLLLTGVIVIITNYMGILPGGENNWFLLVGIGQVTAGFIAATGLR